MIVVDASVVVEMLLWTRAGEVIGSRLFTGSETCCAPHLLDVEVAQVLRRYAMAHKLDEPRGREALTDLSDLPIDRYPHAALLTRAWELKENLTVYDAVYVALAEALNATLITRDRRLASTPGHQAEIALV